MVNLVGKLFHCHYLMGITMIKSLTLHQQQKANYAEKTTTPMK